MSDYSDMENGDDFEKKPWDDHDDDPCVRLQGKFAHYLRTTRIHNDLTQQQMATRMEMSEDHYKKLEKGKSERIVNLYEYLQTAAAVGNLNLKDFLGYLGIAHQPEDNEQKRTDPENSLIKNLRKLPIDTRSEFKKTYCTDNTDQRKFASMIELANLSSGLSDDSRLLMKLFIHSLAKKTKVLSDDEHEDIKKIYESLR